MKLLIDNQLPAALAVHLRSRGHQCAHVLELGLDEASDLGRREGDIHNFPDGPPRPMRLIHPRTQPLGATSSVQ